MFEKLDGGCDGGIRLYGIAPPKLASAPDRLREIAAEQVARLRLLAPEGLVVYDIQDEPGRGGEARPFPFLPTVDPDVYARKLFEGCDAHREEIDALIRKYSEHWALERMPVIDRALLRIGTYELAWVADTPTAVVITEAVELAKEYSTKDSGRFVNGLLARIAEAEKAGVKSVPALLLDGHPFHINFGAALSALR